LSTIDAKLLDAISQIKINHYSNAYADLTYLSANCNTLITNPSVSTGICDKLMPNEANALKFTLPETISKPPANLTAFGGPGTVTFNWFAPNDTGGGIIHGYKIETSTSSLGPYGILVANTGSDNTTYTETVCDTDANYYRVDAITDMGVSNPSNSVYVSINGLGSCSGGDK
jgi:hypothetical protein